jgi:Rrf2 family protein
MKLSQESLYGMEVMVALATSDAGRPLGARELAGVRDFPANFLAKILQKLVRGGLVVSSRGRRRGYSLSLPPGRISVRDILTVTEGPDCFRRCMFRPGPCSDEAPCILHALGVQAREDLEERLAALTLTDLAARG